MAFSDEHSSLVEVFQNLTTGYIYSQHHVMFDFFFKQFVELGKIKWSLIIFSINVWNTIEIFMLRNILDKTVK